MTPKWKKRLAREGLTLAICLGVGFLLPLLLILVSAMLAKSGVMTIGEYYAEFLSDLVAPVGASHSGPGPLLAKLFVLGPYLVFQFVRSIIWAVKTLHAPSNS